MRLSPEPMDFLARLSGRASPRLSARGGLDDGNRGWSLLHPVTQKAHSAGTSTPSAAADVFRSCAQLLRR